MCVGPAGHNRCNILTRVPLYNRLTPGVAVHKITNIVHLIWVYKPQIVLFRVSPHLFQWDGRHVSNRIAISRFFSSTVRETCHTTHRLVIRSIRFSPIDGAFDAKHSTAGIVFFMLIDVQWSIIKLVLLDSQDHTRKFRTALHMVKGCFQFYFSWAVCYKITVKSIHFVFVFIQIVTSPWHIIRMVVQW